jgi:hypothetical protein
VLAYESTEQLLAEPAPRRYLHTVVLTALRDKADRVEVRFGEGEGMLYYRVDGRDWELMPPPDDIYPVLKDTVREVARLVRPERPDLTVMFGVPDARFEPLETGWLTYQLGGYWVDIAVRIDPRDPFGFIRFDIDEPQEFADAAGDALADYAANLSTDAGEADGPDAAP